jgi:hypothetical protein
VKEGNVSTKGTKTRIPQGQITRKNSDKTSVSGKSVNWDKTDERGKTGNGGEGNKPTTRLLLGERRGSQRNIVRAMGNRNRTSRVRVRSSSGNNNPKPPWAKTPGTVASRTDSSWAKTAGTELNWELSTPETPQVPRGTGPPKEEVPTQRESGTQTWSGTLGPATRCWDPARRCWDPAMEEELALELELELNGE